MSGEVAAYTAGTVAGRATAAASHPAVASTAGASWEATVPEWADQPIPPLPRDALGSGVHDLAGVRRSGSRFVQERRAWCASPSAVRVHRLERAVEKRGDGRFSPSGPWRLAATETHTVQGSPRVTRGSLVPEVTSGAGEAGGSRAVPRDQAAATRAAVHLPAPVQSGMARLVPEPETYLGEIVRWDGSTIREEVALLRMGGGRALVVVASRTGVSDAAVARAAWQIVQYRLDLTPPSAGQIGRR